MIVDNEFLGFVLHNGIRLVFDIDSTKSIDFSDADFEKVSKAVKLLSDVNFTIKEGEKND